jgi:hypothetical protein
VCGADLGARRRRVLPGRGRRGQWHHPDGGFARSHAAANATRNTVTPPISCRPNGAASALSLGVSSNFVRDGQQVVQAISLYCPGGQPDPSCPETLVVAGLRDESALIGREWFQNGGRTGGGATAVMEARPASRDWQGARLTERVDPGADSCSLGIAAAVCGTGGHASFEVGRRSGQTDLGIGNLSVPWQQLRNSFPDFHFVLSRQDWLAAHGQPGPCTVSCRQTYSCGRGTQAVTYGPFTITYTLRGGTFQPSQLGGILRGAPVGVTQAGVAKR